MKIFSSRFVIGLGMILLVGSFGTRTTFARHRHAPNWTAPSNGPAAEHATLPPEESPTINPAAMPSTSLDPFLKTHLDKILAPLGTPAFVQSDLLADMKEDYAGALPAAADARKPAYQLAMAVCDALDGAIAQRKQAVAALNAVYERRTSEAIQPRGGRQAVKDSDKDEWFFYNGQKNTWLQNAAALRQQIVVLATRQRAAETQAGEWTPSPPVVAEAPPAPPSPAAPPAAAPAPGTDPVVGDWTWPNHGTVILQADHSIQGTRHGTWLYTRTTDAGRNYEMHWAHKGWVDYVVLSNDGKLLDGKRHDGVHVTANR